MDKISLEWVENIYRDAISDISTICSVLNPESLKPQAQIRVWSQKDAFKLDLFDDLRYLPSDHQKEFLEFLGESHAEYMERLKRMEEKEGSLKLLIRLIEGEDPLKPIRLPSPDLGLPKVSGVDSTIATIDQFDCVISIVSAAFHNLNACVEWSTSRSDLYILNPKIVKHQTLPVVNKRDISREISKAMRESEYGLAFWYGGNGIVFIDGSLFGQDKHLINSLIAKGVVFSCIVKNPVSRVVSTWYEDYFNQYGYGNTIDAIAYNDILPPGTRSPYIFAEMISKPEIWCSKVFTYYKPLIPCSTVLRIEIPTDLFYLADKIVEVVHACCTLSGDYSNSTVAPIVHAEYVAKAMLPDPYHIAERIRSILAYDENRLQGSYNMRRFSLQMAMEV